MATAAPTAFGSRRGSDSERVLSDGIDDYERAMSERPFQGSPAKAWLKAIAPTSQIDSNPCRLWADVVEDWANKQPEHPALISASGIKSYRAFADRINRYALWALSVGINSGDKVCLIMSTYRGA